jgi:tetratricopeptide (TPR) repeat protein
MMEAQRLLREHQLKKPIELLKPAIVLARKYDEQILLARLLHVQANRIKHTNVKRAIDILLTAKELSEQLGYLYNLGMVQSELGHIMGIRGELNTAIDCSLEHTNILNSLGCLGALSHAITAFYHNQSGNGEEAVERAKIAIDLVDSSPRYAPFAHAQMAYALINLGRNDEATAELAIAQKMVAKSGDSRIVVWCRLVEGILDKVERRFDSAAECFREVLKFTEKDPVPLWQNICYLNLTDVEIETQSEESLNTSTEFSGPWMQKLVEYAENNDFPGIAAQALLLKAKLRHRQEQYDEVRKLITKVQKTAKAPGMRYLNDMAISMFPEFIVS